jgi:hypothetical protein
LIEKSSIASTNQNAIDQQHSQNEQKENQQSSIPSSSSISFTTDHPVELQINANNKIESIKQKPYISFDISIVLCRSLICNYYST